VLDVWQRPEAFSAALETFISLFETILQTPQPWYYAHATMLEPGRARKTATLMRIVNTKRTPDGRLQVLVQGMGRLRILNETQSEPFPRVDAQLLIDAEALLRAEVDLADVAMGSREYSRLRTVNAVARERAWWAHDMAGFDDDTGVMPGALLRFNASVDLAATRAFEAQEGELRLSEARAAWSDAGAQAAAADGEYSWDGVCPDFFMDISAADAAEAEAEQQRCALVASLEELPSAATAALSALREIGSSRAEELEVACWVELGALLDQIASLNAALPMEAQLEAPRLRAELLGLLPHAMPPSLGATAQWPDDFRPLHMLALVDSESAMRVDPSYPAWRRAARLSFATADVLAQLHGASAGGSTTSTDEAGELAELQQELLEAVGTSDRLRLILRRLREVRGRLS